VQELVKDFRNIYETVLRKKFWSKRDKVKGRGEDYRLKSFMLCIPLQILLG
jgi:hypothetical protein